MFTKFNGPREKPVANPCHSPATFETHLPVHHPVNVPGHRKKTFFFQKCGAPEVPGQDLQS